VTRFSPSACGGLRIALANVEVMLRWSGALWLERERTLVVADLHFEKGSSYAARFGQMLPPYDTRETLDRLDRELTLLSPDRLIFLGDSFHDGAAEDRLAADDAARLRALSVARDLIWAVGNHDADGPRALPGQVIDELSIGGLILRHEPEPGLQPGEVAGHLHPAARVSSGRGSVRKRCFVTDGQRLILPAFGASPAGSTSLTKRFPACSPPRPWPGRSAASVCTRWAPARCGRIRGGAKTSSPPGIASQARPAPRACFDKLRMRFSGAEFAMVLILSLSKDEDHAPALPPTPSPAAAGWPAPWSDTPGSPPASPRPGPEAARRPRT
jgi:uncharacterized protein